MARRKANDADLDCLTFMDLDPDIDLNVDLDMGIHGKGVFR